MIYSQQMYSFALYNHLPGANANILWSNTLLSRKELHSFHHYMVVPLFCYSEICQKQMTLLLTRK